MTDTLNRWAAVVTVLVEAGCEGPNQTMSIPNGFIVGTTARHDGELKPDADDSMGVFNDQAVIAVLEQWFSQTVVPWFEKTTGQNVYVPKWYSAPKEFQGSLGDLRFYDPSPTESFIQCAEALAGVIGGKQ